MFLDSIVCAISIIVIIFIRLDSCAQWSDLLYENILMKNQNYGDMETIGESVLGVPGFPVNENPSYPDEPGLGQQGRREENRAQYENFDAFRKGVGGFSELGNSGGKPPSPDPASSLVITNEGHAIQSSGGIISQLIDHEDAPQSVGSKEPPKFGGEILPNYNPVVIRSGMGYEIEKGTPEYDEYSSDYPRGYQPGAPQGIRQFHQAGVRSMTNNRPRPRAFRFGKTPLLGKPTSGDFGGSWMDP